MFAALVALGLCLYQLLLFDVFNGITAFDDGVILGNALHAYQGALPYRDFVDISPPGLTVIMLPVVAVAHLFGLGSRGALEIARCLTVGVAAANAALAALLMRYRGPLAMLIAGVALACFPLASTADQTLALEPYIVFFCLAGACLAFNNSGEFGQRRQLAMGGVVIGIGVAVQLFAGFAAVVALLICAVTRRRKCWPLGAGLVAGFVVVCAPFFVLAPHAFITQVITAPLSQASHGGNNGSIADRLPSITGLGGLSALHISPDGYEYIAGFIAAIIVLALVIPVRRIHELEWFVVGTTVLTVAAFLVKNDYYPHFSYFSAAFIALLLAITVDRYSLIFQRILGLRSTSRTIRDMSSRPLRRVLSRAKDGHVLVPVGILCVVLAITGFVIPQNLQSSRTLLRQVGDPGPPLTAAIPAGACVLTDYGSYTILANRFESSVKNCPDLVDPFATWLIGDPSNLPQPTHGPYAPGFVKEWEGWLENSQYALFVWGPFGPGGLTPFSPGLLRWFNRHYQKLPDPLPNVSLYKNLDSGQ